MDNRSELTVPLPCAAVDVSSAGLRNHHYPYEPCCNGAHGHSWVRSSCESHGAVDRAPNPKAGIACGRAGTVLRVSYSSVSRPATSSSGSRSRSSAVSRLIGPTPKVSNILGSSRPAGGGAGAGRWSELTFCGWCGRSAPREVAEPPPPRVCLRASRCGLCGNLQTVKSSALPAEPHARAHSAVR